MSSEQDQLLADLAGRCADFFKNLSEFCRNYAKNPSAAQQQKPEPKGQKKKKDKHNNDPNLPKKPVTAYLLYFQQKKPNFVEKYPDLTLSALTKLIAKDWNELPRESKKPYLEKAEVDRQRYGDELGTYKDKKGGQAVTKKKEKKKKLDLEHEDEDPQENGNANDKDDK